MGSVQDKCGNLSLIEEFCLIFHEKKESHEQNQEEYGLIQNSAIFAAN